MWNWLLAVLLIVQLVFLVVVHGECHIVPGGAVGRDFFRDMAVQGLRAGEAQGAVHKILLIVHNQKQLFNTIPPFPLVAPL